MGLRPAWKLEVDGRDITPNVRSRLISISTTDVRGERSDRCEVSFHDDPPVDFPATGRVLKVHLGWDGQVTEIGEYHITRPESSGPPPVFRVSGHAVGHGGTGGGGNAGALALLGTSRQWTATTLGGMAREMAAAMGIRAVVSADVASAPVENVVQDGETYVSTLNRTARERNATFQIIGTGATARLVVGSHVTARTAGTGQALPRIRIARKDVIKWSGGIAQIHELGRVRVRWHSASTGTSGEVAEGSADGPEITLPGVRGSQAEARAAAQGTRDRRRAKARTLELTLMGNPLIRFGTELDMAEALRPGLDGVYRVVEASQNLTASGSYQTTLKAEAVR